MRLFLIILVPFQITDFCYSGNQFTLSFDRVNHSPRTIRDGENVLFDTALVVAASISAQRDFKPLAQDEKKEFIEVKLLILNFDPIIPKKDIPRKLRKRLPKDKKVYRLHDVKRWNDSRKLAEEYISDMKEASHGFIRFKIVKWVDVDTFQTKIDGFTYTAKGYLKCWMDGKKEFHKPDLADFPLTFKQHKVIPMIDSGKVDEVWFMGAPYFGYNESQMAGPGAFYINGKVYGKVKSKRAFVIMGFNYERGVAEMLHSNCHRVESTMSRIYGGKWRVDELTNNWARFAANHKQSKGVAAVGTCHWPPNAEKGYDYGNKRFVNSSADDWLNYPNLTGKKKKVNRENWGGPNYHRNYMKWWYSHLPSAKGWNKDGRLNNWWRYLYDFNSFTNRGKPKK